MSSKHDDGGPTTELSKCVLCGKEAQSAYGRIINCCVMNVEAAHWNRVQQLIADGKRVAEAERENKIFRVESDAAMRRWARTMGRELNCLQVGGVENDYDCHAWPDVFAAGDEMNRRIIELENKIKYLIYILG